MISADVAIIGAGFAGIGAAIRLKQEGFTNVVVLEKANDVGGTWRDNSYPGCACDVQSHLYSFSFAQNPDWSRAYSGAAEIWEYLRKCARDAGIMPSIRFGHQVRSARWGQDEGRWTIDTTHGAVSARVLVMAQGALSNPSIPVLPGIESFRGEIFHSAQWNHEFELKGKRVAVIGTGASAIQFVPEIQKRVAELVVFQRTPPWVIGRSDRELTRLERAVFRTIPGAQRIVRTFIYLYRELFLFAFRNARVTRLLERMALRHLEQSVADPSLRARLTPSYGMGCKRILISNDYLPALTQPNVRVITDRIRNVQPDGITDASGVLHAVDAIIYGTGFTVTSPPLARHVHGRDGVTLSDTWNGSPFAHVGTTVHGFPNLFMLMGPNTGLGHNSVVYMIEAQVEYLVQALRVLKHGEAIEPTRAAQAAWLADVDRRMRGTVWVAGGCTSWYLDETGRNSTLWPDFTWRFGRRLAKFDPAEYHISTLPPRAS